MRRWRMLVAVWAIAGLGASEAAQAHFVLQDPPNWQSQDPLGNPQKDPPCGNEAGGTPTGVVTQFDPGETITLTINETIFHPGHYRVVLAVNDRSELPPDPPVTPSPSDECASTEIQDPPVFPVLVDGALVHDSPFNGPRMISVTLPTNVTCTRCTLQVIEYMSSHGAPCFYHHCADISIGAPGGTGGASGSGGASGASGIGGGGNAGSGTGGMGAVASGVATADEGGCSCSVPGRTRPALAFGAFSVALLGLAAAARARVAS